VVPFAFIVLFSSWVNGLVVDILLDAAAGGKDVCKFTVPHSNHCRCRSRMSLVWHAAPRLIATVRQPRYAIAQEGRWSSHALAVLSAGCPRFGPADHPVATVGASAQDIFITPIPNAPFSAVVDVERSSVGRDGSIANSKTVREIARTVAAGFTMSPGISSRFLY